MKRVLVLFTLLLVFVESSCSKPRVSLQEPLPQESAKTQECQIYCVGQRDNDLLSLLEREGIKVMVKSSKTKALETVPDQSAVLLLDRGFGNVAYQLSQEDLALIARKKLRVFAEFATVAESVPTIKTIDLERIVVTKSFGNTLKPMDLLTINKSDFLAEQVEDPDLVIAKVSGFDAAEFGLADTPSYPLVYRPQPHLFLSTAFLSNFSKIRFMPEIRWKLFWEAVLTDLTGRAVQFAEWPAQVKPAFSRDQQLPDAARRLAVDKGIRWFFNGHFLIHPAWKEAWLGRYQGDETMPFGPELPQDLPDGDGSLGILEGHASAIYADGRQAYRYCLRDDVQGEASMAFSIAGHLLGKEDYAGIAGRLLDYSFREFRDGPRNDPASPTFGLLGWMSKHKHVYYGDDNARSILGSILTASLTKEDRWNQMIREAIDANFNTTGKYGFRGERLEDQDIQRNGLAYYQNRELIYPHPHFESWMWACYLWLYSETGDRKYLDLSESGIRLTMQAYPDNWRWSNGIQQERARMLLPLAWLYRVSPTAEHRDWIFRMVEELKVNQVSCGAIREELGNPAAGFFGTQQSNAEYGITEAPLIFRNGDPVSDMLYTCNFAVFGLHEAASATGDAGIREMAERLAEFLVRIQAKSDTYKSVDGAWYRAFNFRNWDYWASNADAGWGALGTLTGWTQSWIVTTLALMEMETSYWDLTHGGGLEAASH